MTSRALFMGAAAIAAFGAGLAAAQTPAQWQDVIRNLRHPNVDTRLHAVERLGEADYTPAAEAVAALVADPDDRVQAEAIDAELTFFLTDRITSVRVMGMGGSKSRAQQAFDAGPLLRTSAPAPPALIDRLIAAMRDENARIRFDAAHALGFIAEAPLPEAQARALVDGLDHYDPIIRVATARVLGRLRAREAGDKLIAALGDSNSSVREYAVQALGLIREERALSLLRSMVIRRTEFAPDAVLALARIASADDRGLFRERLNDRGIDVRRAAVEGLGRLRDQDSLGAIDQISKTDPSPEVRLAAAFALQRLGQTQSHVIASMLALGDLSAQARDYLFELGHDAIPGVGAALKTATESRYRANLAQVVGYIGAPDDAGLIEPLLQERDERVVRAATNAIARLRR